jgi:hypothetical protein
MTMPLLPRRNVLGLLFGATIAKAVAPGLAQSAPAGTSSAGLAPLGQVDLRADGMQLVITGSGSALPDPRRGGASCAVVIDGVVCNSIAAGGCSRT